MRRTVLVVFACLSLIGAVVAALATTAQRDFNLRGYVDPTQDANLPFHVPRLGVNADLMQYPSDDLTVQFEQMQAARITWVRQFFRWDQIEFERGVYDWQPVDSIVEALQHYPDLQMVAVLVNSPAWARASNTTETAPPQNPDDFAAFARAFAERYGNAIDHYQIWDEPNLMAAWGTLEPRPSQYAALLQAAYRAIHSADPGATVIAAALAPTTETGPKNLSDWLYLRDLYTFGAKDFMDAAAAKPYGFDLPPSDRTVDARLLNFSRVVGLREIMVQNGDGTKALWAGHWGWNSLPSGWTGRPSIWGQVSAEQQIQYTLDALARVEREWPWLGGMILHHWQPAAAAEDPAWGFALLDSQGQPTPLLEALKQRPEINAAQTGLYAAANPYARYSGVWRFSDLGADIGWINNSRAEFDFAGTDIALLLRQDDYVAYLYPTVDGQQANALPKDPAGNACIILTSDTLQPEMNLVPVARGLPPGQHTLRIVTDELVPDEAANRWALVGYAVSSGSLAEPYNRQLALAWLTAAIAAAAVVVTGRDIRWRRAFMPFANLWQQLSDTGRLAISALTSAALMIGLLLTWNDSTPALFRREPVQLGLALLTAGVIYVEPGLLLTLAALVALFVMIYNRIDLGLTLVIFYAPFFLFPVELYRFAFPMSEILMLLTGGAWLLRALATWGRARQSSVSQLPATSPLRTLKALDWGVLAWVALGFASLAWATYRPQAVTELRVILIEPALFYLVARTTYLDRKIVLRLVDALLFAGVVVSVVGFVLFIQGEATITAEEGARRLASVYGSPNNVGLFLGRCIPFALALSLVKTDGIRCLWGMFAFVVMLLAVMLSQSAGALLIGVPAAVAAVLLLVWRRRALLPLAGLAGAGTAAFFLALRLARFARLLDFSGGTNFARIRVWQSTVNMLRDHPLTGLGLDQFLYAFRGQYIMPDAWQEPNLSHPHNVILDFWVRLGILGVGVFLWIQLAFWQAAFRAYQHLRARAPLDFALIVGVMGSMVNLLAHGLVDNSVYVNDLAYVFALLLALALRLSNARAIDEPA